MRYFDIDGNEFTQDAWKWVNNLLGEITNRLQKLDRKISRKLNKINSGKGGNGTRKSLAKLQSKKTGLNEVQGEIGLLAASDQLYDVKEFSGSKVVGNQQISSSQTTYDKNTDAIVINLNLASNNQIATFAHELKHAFQFETGKVAFSYFSGRGASGINDITDEIEGYKRGQLFGANASANINEAWVRKRTGRYDTPLGPYDINSYRTDAFGNLKTYGETFLDAAYTAGSIGRMPGSNTTVVRGWKASYIGGAKQYLKKTVGDWIK